MDAGTTLYVPDPGASYDSHLWMIISDPKTHPEKVVIVNFTSWEDWKDQACVVDVGEHSYIKKRTCVNFEGAKVVGLGDLLALENSQRLSRHEKLSSALLHKIRSAIAASRMKLNHAQLLIDQGVIEDC